MLTRNGFRSTLALLALLLALPLVAQQVFTPHHVARLRTVTEAVLSPDGENIACVLGVPRQAGKEKDGEAWAELHVVDREGNSRPYVVGQVNVRRVAWTPDGQEVAFLAKRGDDKYRSLYAILLAGGEARRLAAHEEDIEEFSFSPDGKQVAFLAKEAEPEAKKKLKEQGFNQEVFEEELRNVRVWMVELNEENAEARALDLPGSASELHWSPAGAHLAVALAPTPLIDDHYMKRRVHVVEVETGRLVARVDNPGKLGEVEWSPDGQHLALVSAADPHDPLEGRLMVAAATGGPLREAVPNYEGHVRAIEWQDSDTLMFLGAEGVWTTFNEVRCDGAERNAILPDGRFALTDFTLAADGQSGAFVGETPRHPAEVFFMAHGMKEPRRLTDSNLWLGEMRFAAQEVVRFKARDGLELEGILVRPLDEVKGQRYPLILAVHGGPESHYHNGWMISYSLPGQTAAARGFAVFYPNYRGSTGQGVEFSKLSQGDPAGKEFDDLVDAVDAMVAMGLADPKHVGITGGSYGGYASAWGATYYSDRFAAAVMFVGISDKLMKYGTTDIANEEYMVHHGQLPWEAWDEMRARSPLYYVEQARTPILILGGTDDERVHPTQSMVLYRYLKVLGKTPVRWVRYPGEKHGNRRAAARLDYNLRMLQWMEHYLKGPGGEPPPLEIDYGLEEAKE